MKKLFLGCTFAAVLLGGMARADLGSALGELNAKIEALLLPIRNAQTEAQLAFDRIEVSADRALAVAMHAHYKKTGNHVVSLDINDVSYTYGDGTAPQVHFDGRLGIDLTKFLKQEELNGLVPDIERLIHDLSKNYLASYGEAAEVVVQVTDKVQDKDGNYRSVKGYIAGKIDVTKLPQAMPLEELRFTAFEATIVADLNSHIGVDLRVVINPAHRSFKSDQPGLKELLEKLLAGDERLIKDIEKFMRSIDEFAADLVNRPLPSAN